LEYAKLLLLSNALIFIGVFLSGLGVFGKFYFENNINLEKDSGIFTININPSKKNEYLLSTVGNGLIEVKTLFVEIIEYKRKVIDDYGVCMCGAHLGRSAGDYIIPLDIRKRFYPIIPITNDNSVNNWRFKGDDFEKISIQYLFPEDYEIKIRLVAELYDTKRQEITKKYSSPQTLFKNSRSTCSDRYHFGRAQIPLNKNKEIKFEPLTYKILIVEDADSLIANLDASSIPDSVKENFIWIIKNYDDQTQAGRIYIDRAFKFITDLKLIELVEYLPDILSKEDRFLMFEVHRDKIKNLFSNIDTEKRTNAWHNLKEAMINRIEANENKIAVIRWESFVKEVDASFE